MKTIPVEVTTVDLETGNEKTDTVRMTLVDPKVGVCAVCAVDHHPALPHDCTSLYYQYQFYGQHEAWPTWADAVAHCEPAMQESWRLELMARQAWTEPNDRAPIAQPYEVQS